MIYDQKVNFKHVKAELGDLSGVFAAYGSRITAAYLFGSLALGQEKPLSDIDIAVLLANNMTLSAMQTIEEQLYLDLTAKLKTEEIDLIVLNRAPMSIRYGVLKSKRRIFCSDKSKTLDFEAETVLKYLDFKPYREEMQREFLKGLKRR